MDGFVSLHFYHDSVFLFKIVMKQQQVIQTVATLQVRRVLFPWLPSPWQLNTEGFCCFHHIYFHGNLMLMVSNWLLFTNMWTCLYFCLKFWWFYLCVFSKCWTLLNDFVPILSNTRFAAIKLVVLENTLRFCLCQLKSTVC